ncbi:cell wall integrity stress response component [Fusarium circinatum]|uniref:Cell wall integrity stress response component n=1 Tax=Fusarium circinatum TaxID=48490 RepID=A0A8H5U7N3_FUSCI|nr:cell wall integrity stress response component [Fusarium circinatum]
MSPLFRHAQQAGLLFLIASSWAPLAATLNIEYCADYNTGETPRNTSIYQTNGLCHDFCIDDWAYAITQDKLCWCSNYAPVKSTQVDDSKCDTPCPAWPDEVCGGDGVYGYVSLGNVEPSGSRGPSPSSTSTEDETSVTSTAEDESTTSSSSSRTSVLQTVTAGGTIRTVTVAAPTETGGTTASENTNGSTTEKSGLGTGQVVGIVVGVIAAVIGAAALALFLWFRRKKQQNEQEAYQDDPSVRDSSSGIARPDMSMAGSPIASAAAGSRNSTLQVDPRMDPFKQGLYVRSASHESINTLRDDHDYSRRIQAPKVLRATNPDPTPEP